MLGRVLTVGLVLAVVVGFLGLHAGWMNAYLRRASDTVFRADAEPTPRAAVQQGFAVDGQVWIHHALKLAEGGSWRVRHTDLDNPPAGREVHWSSGWAWWLLGWGKLRAMLMGEPVATAVERAAVWANLPFLLMGMAVMAVWAGRRWGAIAVVMLAAGMAGHRDFYEALYPGYPDHHGSIVICLLGMLLGGVLMGAGWWKPASREQCSVGLPTSEEDALRAATGSALFGATGMWISAASLVIPLAMLGVSAVCAVYVLARPLQVTGAIFSTEVWRRWGRVGAGASVGFYLLEYFPGNMGMRLEVNHPLYALGWWAGAEVIAGWGAWAAGARLKRREFGWCLGAIVALVILAGVFWFAGEGWFVLRQPFMIRLYHHVDELRPLWFNITRDGWWPHADHAGLYLVPFGLGLWLLFQRTDPVTRLFLFVIMPVAAALTALGWWQCRWLLTAGAAQILMLLVIVARWREGAGVSRAPSLSVAVAVAVVFWAPVPWKLWQDVALVERARDVRLPETLQLFYRDVAQAVLESAPRGGVVLLASPNASAAVSYYGDVRSVGTFYWENHQGLRRAAEIWMAGSDDEAARLVRETGVTHVLVSAPHDFLAEYHDALRPGYSLENTFGYRLAAYRLPIWLRPIAYRPPAVLDHLRLRGDLFVTDFTQTAGEARLRQGLYLKERGEIRAARESLAESAEAGNSSGAAELAWMLATHDTATERNGPRALRWAQAAAKAEPENARFRAVLAAAFAEVGRFPEANGAILFAMELAEAVDDPVLTARLQMQFNAYQRGRPWRE